MDVSRGGDGEKGEEEGKTSLKILHSELLKQHKPGATIGKMTLKITVFWGKMFTSDFLPLQFGHYTRRYNVCLSGDVIRLSSNDKCLHLSPVTLYYFGGTVTAIWCCAAVCYL